MGGSGSGGGGFLGSAAPRDLADLLRQSQLGTSNETYVADVERVLADALADANNRDVAAINGHLDEIKQALDGEIEGVVDLLFGGSLSKKTYVDGLSDVDALLVINDTELATQDPAAVCRELRTRLADIASVEPDGFSTKLTFGDLTIEVIPVIHRGDTYLLPNADSTKWSRVRPTAFTGLLTKTNQECGGKVVPVIKLAKILLSALPEQRRPGGYHVENLAVEAFSGYQGPFTPRQMLHHFFSVAPNLIRQTLPDRTGQSKDVAPHLGDAGSTQRLVMADAVDRIGRRLRNADGASDLGEWKRLIGED